MGRGSRVASAAALGWGLTDILAGDARAAELAARAAADFDLQAAAQLVPSYIADVSGNGVYGKADEKIIRRALNNRRGLEIHARDEGYDYRADLFGRGRVDRTDLKSISMTLKHLKGNPDDARSRPVTVCWHYGWYNFAAREPRRHHVWFKGGGYSSRDPKTEALFNNLKNEFGITVDALSWADPKTDGNLNNNLYLGYFNAPNGRTRYAALLYESLISLRAKPGDRIDFQRNVTRKRLIEHFRDMGRTFRRLRDDSKARVFLIDGRPVMFIYASHTWGTNVDGTGAQYDRIDQAMEAAITAFENAYGKRPFIVGEETTFAEPDRFDEGRRRRSANFDGIFNYVHASSADFIQRGGQNLRGQYVEQVQEVLRNTYAGAMEHRSRFTNKQILVIPSFAAGFSKVGVPTLHVNRVDYGNFLKNMLAFHETEYMVPAFGVDAPGSRPAIVSVGSWNEEWEGHAIMPSQFNRTLAPRTQKGFDLVMAIKQACGWNHYASGNLDPFV